MCSPTKQVEGAFWSGDIGFVSDPKHVDARLPGATKLRVDDFHEKLVASRRLPDLNGAPVASWVLARCAYLSGKRFPYSYDEVMGSDGGDYWLSFIAFTSDFRPIGSLYILGAEKTVCLGAESSAPNDPQTIIDQFTAAILKEPLKLKKTLLTVVYTSLEDPEHWKRLPYVFGWTRNRFVGRTAPEHAISEDDYDF